MSARSTRLASVTLDLDTWTTWASTLPEGPVGSARIRRTKYGRGYYHAYRFHGYEFFHARRSLPITVLEQYNTGAWEEWMVDDPPHWWAMQTYAEHAEGRVLVGGLGLGMLTKLLLDNPRVTQVVVVEHNPDVVALIQPHLPTDPRLRIAIADFYDAAFTAAQDSYDHIIADLWVTNNEHETKRVLDTEVRPLAARLQTHYPNAHLTFHGFGNPTSQPTPTDGAAPQDSGASPGVEELKVPEHPAGAAVAEAWDEALATARKAREAALATADKAREAALATARRAQAGPGGEKAVCAKCGGSSSWGAGTPLACSDPCDACDGSGRDA